MRSRALPGFFTPGRSRYDGGSTGEAALSRMADIFQQIARCGSLHADLSTEYDRCIGTRAVSAQLAILTHELNEKIANILDQTFHLAWEVRLKPRLPPEQHQPRGYFVCGSHAGAVVTGLKKWYAADLATTDPVFYRLIESCQPYLAPDKDWILEVREIARHKHIRLLPQEVRDESVKVFETPLGRITWRSIDPARSPVVVFGAPVHRTVRSERRGRVVSTAEETWTSIAIAGMGLDPKIFGALCVHQMAALVQQFERELGLA